MYKLFLSLMVISLFVGCSSKEEKALLASYDKNIKYHKNLQKTEKTELFNGEQSVAVLTATHLYTTNYDKKDERDEVFIVGVQFEDTDISRMNFDKNVTYKTVKKKKIRLAGENEYILTIKNKHATKVTKLAADDKRLEGISFVSDWGDYYEVRFPNSGKKFILVFDNFVYGKGQLNFSKVAKFVYTKKGF